MLDNNFAEAANEFSKLFYHSILYRFITLTHRLSENIAIDPAFNDVVVAVGDLVVSCFHFADQIRGARPDWAASICLFPDYNKISDIANTHKHFERTVKNREAKITAHLAFEISEDGRFGFIGTQVFADCPAWGNVDCFQLLQEFIALVIKVTGFNKGKSFEVDFLPSNFYPEARIRYTEKTYSANGSTLKGYHRNTDGSLVPAAGADITMEVTFEVSGKVQIGAWVIDFGNLRGADQ